MPTTATEPISLVERPVSAPPIGSPVTRQSSDPAMIGIGLLAGSANVVMQLSRPGIGYGVKDSRVESGRIDRHPIKRARTTFTYIAVAINGTIDQKAAYRRAVNRAHAQVYSRPEDPLAYNAFDPELQMWVAACMYKGIVDVYRLFVGEMDDETADQHYRDAAGLGTMLQVPLQMWPKDRKAFDEYWREQLDKVHIDDSVRNFLYPIAAGRPPIPLPRWLRRPVAGSGC